MMRDPVVQQWWAERGPAYQAKYLAQPEGERVPINPHVLRADFTEWLAGREERQA